MPNSVQLASNPLDAASCLVTVSVTLTLAPVNSPPPELASLIASIVSKNRVKKSSPASACHNPFWFGSEEPDHVRNIMAAYHRLLKIDADRPANSRRPKCFIGSVKRLQQTQPSAPTTTPFRTIDQVCIYQLDAVPLDSPLPQVATHHLAVIWDREDGLPVRITVLDSPNQGDSATPVECARYQQELLRCPAGSTPTYLYSLPFFERDHPDQPFVHLQDRRERPVSFFSTNLQHLFVVDVNKSRNCEDETGGDDVTPWSQSSCSSSALTMDSLPSTSTTFARQPTPFTPSSSHSSSMSTSSASSLASRSSTGSTSPRSPAASPIPSNASTCESPSSPAAKVALAHVCWEFDDLVSFEATTDDASDHEQEDQLEEDDDDQEDNDEHKDDNDSDQEDQEDDNQEDGVFVFEVDDHQPRNMSFTFTPSPPDRVPCTKAKAKSRRPKDLDDDDDCGAFQSFGFSFAVTSIEPSSKPLPRASEKPRKIPTKSSQKGSQKRGSEAPLSSSYEEVQAMLAGLNAPRLGGF